MNSITAFVRSILIFSLIAVFAAMSSENTLRLLIEKIEYYNNQFYERIYVHTSKEVLHPDDLLWFSALITGTNNRDSDSKEIYISLLNIKDQEVLSSRYPVINGKATGALIIPDVNFGDYRLFAYTKKSLRNKSSFIKNIKVVADVSPSILSLTPSNTLIKSNLRESKLELNLNKGKDNVNVHFRNNDIQDVFFFASINGVLTWASVETSIDTTSFAIPIDDLPMGSLIVSVVSTTGDLIASKSLFIHQEKKSQVKIMLNKDTLQINEKTKVTLKVVNDKNEPVGGDLSISVSKMNANLQSSLSAFSYMYNHFAAAYNDDNYWSSIGMYAPARNKEPAERYILSGRVFDNNGAIKSRRIMAVESTGQIFYQTRSEKDGYFSFEIDSTYLFSKFIVGPKQGKNNNTAEIDFYPPRLQYLSVEGVSGDSLCEVQFNNEFKMLEEVVIKDQRKVNDDHDIIFPMYKNVAVDRKKGEELSYLGESGVDPGTGFISLLKQVTLVSYTGSGGDVLLRGVNSGGGGAYPVLFVLNGVPMGHSYHSLDFVMASAIEEIIVIRGVSAAVQFGHEAIGGAVVVKTKEGSAPNYADRKSKLNKVSKNYFVTSYFPDIYSRSNKAANYISFNNECNPITLYWEGDAVLNDTGELTIEYLNSCIPGEVLIEVEGIDEEGNFISGAKRYIVN